MTPLYYAEDASGWYFWDGSMSNVAMFWGQNLASISPAVGALPAILHLGLIEGGMCLIQSRYIEKLLSADICLNSCFSS